MLPKHDIVLGSYWVGRYLRNVTGAKPVLSLRYAADGSGDAPPCALYGP
jgi:hypothetical protein